MNQEFSHTTSLPTEKKKREFLPYIHYYRGLAILIIVGIHVRMSMNWQNELLKKTLIVLLDNGTIFFIFISGFLFFYLYQDKLDFKSYLIKKVRYVLIPYLIFSALPLLDKLFWEQTAMEWLPSYVRGNMLLEALYMLLTGKHFGPFWFISVIFFFFFLAPILRRVSSSRYFTLVTFSLLLASLWCWQFGYFSYWWLSVIYFLPVYILGMWTAKYKDIIVKFSIPILIICLVAYIFLFYLEWKEIIDVHRLISFNQRGSVPLFSFSIPKLKTLFMTMILLCLFYKIRKIEIPQLGLFGNISFAIFFLHLYFIIMAEHLKLEEYLSMNNSLYFIIYFLFVVGASTAVFYTGKFLFGKNSRYVLGS